MSTQAIAQPKIRRISPFAALLWEEWRQTRLPLLLGTALIFLCLLGTIGLAQTGPQNLGDEYKYYSVGPLLFLLFVWQTAVLLFSGYGRNDMTMQFPRRLFALPVHSTALALTRLAYGIAVVAITFGLLGWFLSDISRVFRPGYQYAFEAVRALVLVESVAWLLGRWHVLAIGAGFLLWIASAVLYRELEAILYDGLAALLLEKLANAHQDYLGYHDYFLSLGTMLPITLIWCAVFGALAVYAVRTQRHGGGKRFTTWRSMGKAQPDDLDAPQAPERALFGYEWRRRGRWVPMFGLMSAFLLMMLFSGVTMSPIASYFALLLGCLSGLFAAGLFQFLVSERERVSGLQRFLMTRPASTRKLALARLRALGTGYSITFVVLCLMMLGALQVMSSQGGTRTLALRSLFSPMQFVEDRVDQIHKSPVSAQALGDRRAPPMVSRYYVGRNGRPVESRTYVHVKYESESWTLIKVLTSIVFFYLLGWLCLTQPLTTLFLFYAVAVLANSLDGKAGWESDWGYTLFSAIVSAGIIGLTVMHLRRAFRRGLLTRRALYTVLAAWFTLAYSVVYLCVRAGGTPREVLWLQSSIVALALVLAASALPFWPFATIPLSIYRHRHQ